MNKPLTIDLETNVITYGNETIPPEQVAFVECKRDAVERLVSWLDDEPIIRKYPGPTQTIVHLKDGRKIEYMGASS